VAKVKLDVGALRAYLAEGHSQADAARHFNVSQAAISLRVRQQRLTTTKVVALERAHEVVNQQLTAAERLQKVQQLILDQLNWAEARAKQPGADRAVLSDTLVKLAAEVRAQIRLEHDISVTLIDLKVVRQFQRTVVEAIQAEAPSVARRIVDRLKAERALRQTAAWPSLDGHGALDVA
jgi:hypothetical protein